MKEDVRISNIFGRKDKFVILVSHSVVSLKVRKSDFLFTEITHLKVMFRRFFYGLSMVVIHFVTMHVVKICPVFIAIP